MRTLLGLVLLSVVAVVTGAGGVASAATVKPLPVPAGARYVGSDGVDRVVYLSGPPAQKQVGVRDLRTGRATSFALPQADCGHVTASAGGIATSCGYVEPSGFDMFVRDYDAAAWTSVPFTFPPFAGMESATITGIGRNWLAVNWADYHVSVPLLLPRSGGTIGVHSRTADGKRWVPDLDAANPERPLCRPLTRTAQAVYDEEVSSPWAPILYAKPWALDGPAQTAKEGVPSTLRLRHCGGTVKPRTLCGNAADVDFPAGGCNAPSLSTRYAAWSQGPVGYVRDLRKGTTTRVRVPGQFVWVFVVGSHVVVSTDASLGVLRR